jgi:transposase InsO family protein
MGWREVSIMSQRQEFINFVLQEGTNFAELCRRFNISRKTGYKFLNRYNQHGIEDLRDRSRRPRRSPERTDSATEQLIIALRQKHASWGGRKLKRRLEDLGYMAIPCPSTITAILKRFGCIAEQESQKHRAWTRFEAQYPNDLWQMDFKGDFAAHDSRCYPLTVLDDHSRYSLCIAACGNQRRQTVQQGLTNVFRTYGLPVRMLMDNGSPWGDSGTSTHTKFTVWLMKLGIAVSHSRPCHPQTMGKDERFHRSLKAEAIAQCLYKPIERCQEVFDDWRMVYNTQRPHESLNMQTPSRVYMVSKRSFPERLPGDEYAPGDMIRKVYDQGGFISFKNKTFRIGRAFEGERVAIRPAEADGHFDVVFYAHHITTIDLTETT